MMAKIEIFAIARHDTLKAALTTLERAPVKLCIVVDDLGRVERTVTDGDIRRALLSGLGLDASISDVAGRTPVTMPQGTPRTELIETLDAQGVDAIVLVDDEGRPTGLAERTALTKTLFLSPPHMGEMEASYVRLAFEENFIAPAGTNLMEFEAALCKVSGRDHALAVSSGTAGLHLALRVLDIGRNDRVYVSDSTFIASVQPILYQDATPVLIDCEPQSWNMSPDALERAMARDAARGTLPKAIVVVHLYGQSADMDRIMALADAHGVPVVEDAAESLGARYGGRPSGAHGLISVYSFNGNKIITTSGGGAMVSECKDLIDRARSLATQGRDAAEHYQHSEIAYNYRMSNVLAGIGRGQLEVLDARIAARRAVFERYRAGLTDIPGISFQSELPGSFSNRWLTVVRLDADQIGIHPYQLLRGLQKQGMEARPSWKPMQMQPLLHGAEFWPHSPDQAVGPALFLSSLCLPSGSAMNAAEQNRVIDVVSDFCSGKAAA